MCQKAGLIGDVNKLKSIIENERVKTLWDLNIQTDHMIQHRRPDVVIVYKKERKCQADIAIPGDSRVELKEHEKADNYNELKREVKKI